jgi:hypothetical protein
MISMALTAAILFLPLSTVMAIISIISYSINDPINASFKDLLSCLPAKILTLIVCETNFHFSLIKYTIIAMYAKF